MDLFTCNRKIYDKNNVIIGYQLENLNSGQCIEVSSKILKENILNGKVVVNNLKLTSDNRLIDNVFRISKEEKDNELDKNIPKTLNQLLEAYQSDNKLNKKKLQYVMSKMNSKRIGKAVTRALLLGLMCSSVLSTTACGSVSSIDTTIESEITTNNEVSDIVKKINEAKNIKIDVKNLTLNNKAIVYIDGEKIGELTGKFIAIYDRIDFKSVNGSKLATGDQNFHMIYDDWAIYDENDNFKYGFEEVNTISGFFNAKSLYNIYDKDKNVVAVLKENSVNPLNHSAEILDTENKVIAKIEQGNLKHDFNIEVLDNSKLDNVTITTLATDYMMQRLSDGNKKS